MDQSLEEDLLITNDAGQKMCGLDGRKSDTYTVLEVKGDPSQRRPHATLSILHRSHGSDTVPWGLMALECRTRSFPASFQLKNKRRGPFIWGSRL